MSRTTRALTATAVLALTSGLTVACGSAEPTSSGDKTAFTMGIAASPQGWDPYDCVGSTRTVLSAAYDTLTRVTADGGTEPSVATSWGYTTPTDFHLTLREDVEFSDGTPLNADVVKANLDRAASNPTAVTAQFAADKPSITVQSDTELTISLGRADPDLAYLFSDCGGMIVHPNLVADPALMTTEVEGSGPYALDAASTVTDSTYVFEKKSEYWNTEAYPFEKAVFSIIPDSNAMLSALLSGQIDVSVAGSFQALQQVESAGKAHIEGNVSQFAVVLSDRAGELVPALGDERVRQALNYAIDRPAIIETLFGERGLPTPQISAKSSTSYEAALDERFPFDPQKAKDLLSEAGYPDGFAMTVLTTGVLQFDTFLSAVADYWKQIGVTVDQKVADTPTYLTDKFTKKYPAFVEPLTVVPTYSALNKYFGPTATFNPYGSVDAEFSEAMDKAAAGDDAALGDAAARIMDLGWCVCVGFNAQYIFYDPTRITGLEMLNSANQPLFYDWRPPTT